MNMNLRRNVCFPKSIACLLLAGAMLAVMGASAAADEAETFQQREFAPRLAGKWIGQGVAYGPYRAGQAPLGRLPTITQVVEDLELMAGHWNLIRMYGAREVTADALVLIREDKLPIRVMLGAWIANETPSDTISVAAAQRVQKSNQAEVAAAIKLAKQYPDVVIAVCVGNETQVSWSEHRTNPDVLIGYIRQVRAAVKAPVTTADDFKFWTSPESQQVAGEIDFIVSHHHPLWLGQKIETALAWTQETFAAVRKQHPHKQVVIGETGWATKSHNKGKQAELIKGAPGEAQQRKYYREFTAWTKQEQVVSFFFEAFDEPWKGGAHPNEVEKHWGLFYENRKPKPALRK